MIVEFGIIVLSFIAGLLLGHRARENPPTHINDGWSIWVESTDDPSIYRCVYMKHGRVHRSTTGTGVGGAMDEMISEIDDPDE